MPILQVIDPYAGSGLGEAAEGFASGFMPNPKAAAEAQSLAARIRLTNQQQQHLAAQQQQEQEKFRWEEQDRQQKLAADAFERKRMQGVEDAAGRYWGTRPQRPQGVNGAQPTQQQLDDWYSEQNYYDQMARAAIHAGKGMKDISEGMGDFADSYQRSRAAPAPVGPGGLTAEGLTVPQMPAGVTSPEAQKKWRETMGKQVADAQMDTQISRQKAARNLPQLLTMRDRWEDAAKADAIGGVSSAAPFAYMANVFGTDRAKARAAYEAAQQAIIGSPENRHQGEGQVSNYERELFAKPFATTTDPDAETGRTKMNSQFALTLRTLGVPDVKAEFISNYITHGAPRGMVDHLVSDLQNGNLAGVDQFLEAAQMDLQRRGGR